MNLSWCWSGLPRLAASQRHLSLTSHNLVLFLQHDDVLQEKCDVVLHPVCTESTTCITVHQGSSTSPLLTLWNGFCRGGLPYTLQDVQQHPRSLPLDATSTSSPVLTSKNTSRHCQMSPQMIKKSPLGNSHPLEISASL